MSPTRNNCAEPLPEALRLKLYRTPRTSVILSPSNTGLIYDEYQPVPSENQCSCVLLINAWLDIYATLSALDLPEDAKDTCALYPQLYLPTHLCRAHLARLSRKWIHCLLILAALEYDFVRLINISEIPKPCVCVWLPVPSRPDASTDPRPNPLPHRTLLSHCPIHFYGAWYKRTALEPRYGLP